jgi:hexosaminidase
MATPAQWQEARNWLVLWRDNNAKLEPSLGRSEITAELIPVSQTLSKAAAMGLEALDDLENHRTTSANALEKNLDLLKTAAKPQAVLVDMVVPSVQLLVEAAGKP